MTMAESSNKKYVFAIVFTMVAWIASIVFGGLWMAFEADDFKNSSDRTNFEISPAPWAFSIWYLIYLWQLVFFVYCLFSSCRKFDLPRVPMAVFPIYLIHAMFMAVGGVLATKYMFWASFGTIVGMTWTIYLCLFISIRKFYQHRESNKHMSCCKYILYTYAVHNAWSILAAWLTVATLLSMGIAMIHGNMHAKQHCTGTLALGILFVELVLFVGLELTVLEKYLRHVWTHYVALVLACVGIIAKNWDPMNRNSIITVALSGFVACAFMLKMLRMVLKYGRHRHHREDKLTECHQEEKIIDWNDEKKKQIVA